MFEPMGVVNSQVVALKRVRTVGDIQRLEVEAGQVADMVADAIDDGRVPEDELENASHALDLHLTLEKEMQMACSLLNRMRAMTGEQLA